MAGGFSFPPPPPPPPKPASQTQQPDFEYSQPAARGGRGRGGSESRGRGGPSRGRGGNSNFEPLGQHQRSNFNQGPTTVQPRERFEASINAQPPPGSHINPNFTGQRQSAPAPAARQQPTAGHQNRHVPDSGERSPNATRSSYTANRRLSNDGPGRTQAVHKRKLDALRGPQQPREKKPGLQTAPAVPSFGAPILPPTPSATTAQPPVQSQVTNLPNRAQPASRTLGLTPKGGVEPDYPSESEDEEVDEEAQFAELGTKLTFEHNGEVMTLNNEADLAAWKEERRKQFPTTNRVSQKQDEAWRIGEERKRLLAAVARLHQAPRNRKSEVKTRSLREPPKISEATAVPQILNADTPDRETTDSHVAVSGIQEIEDPSEDVPMPLATPTTEDHPVTTTATDVHTDTNIIASPQESALPQLKADQPRALPGINMDETDDESDAEEAAATAEDVDIAAPIEGEAEPSSDAESDSDDGPPEQVSSKPRPSAASEARRPVCRYFSASGMCRDGDSCRFRHELSSKAPSARPAQPQPDRPAFDRFAPKLDPKNDVKKSIFERLMEQEEQSDDRLALQVIKALGQAGLFKQPETEVSV